MKEKKEKQPWDGQGVGMWYDLKRWFYTRFKRYIILKEYRQFPEKDENGRKFTREERPYDCEIVYSLVKKKDKPKEAMRCIGEPYEYAIDRKQTVYPHDTKQDKFTAHMGWLYMEYGGFDKCITKDWNSLSHLDMKKVLIIAGIVIGIAVVMFMARGH